MAKRWSTHHQNSFKSLSFFLERCNKSELKISIVYLKFPFWQYIICIWSYEPDIFINIRKHQQIADFRPFFVVTFENKVRRNVIITSRGIYKPKLGLVKYFIDPQVIYTKETTQTHFEAKIK